MKTYICNGTFLTTRDDQVRVFDDHTLMIQDGVIAAFRPSSTMRIPTANQADVEVVDGSPHIIAPGLINTHHHLYQSLTRGLTAVQDAGLFDWLRVLYTKWRHLDHEAVKLAASVSIAELLLSGCTTTNDHFYIFPQGTDARVESVLEAAEALGIRIHLCRGSMSVGTSKGGLPPDDCVQTEGEILEDCVRAIDAHHDPDPLAMCRIDLAPCSPFSISPELLRDTRDLARERGVLLHTHAAETLDEERYCVDKFGQRPIPFLHEQGWMGEDVYLAHCAQVNDDDIKLLATSRTGVAHCPCSNMRLGSGIAPITKMIDAGVKVGIAVDGSSSNDGSNLLAEVRQCTLLQRVAHGAGALTAAKAFELATVGGAAVLGRKKLGCIEVGMAADLAMFRKDDIALAGAAAQSPLGALVLCHAPRADRVMIAGKTVVKDGHLTTADEHKLAHDLNQLVAKGRFR